MKKCSRCKNWLPKTNFNKNRTKTDGLQNVCKTCQPEYNKKRGPYQPQENPERLRLCPDCKSSKPATMEYFSPCNSRSSDGLSSYCKECQNIRSKRWQAAHPEQTRRSNQKANVRRMLRVAHMTQEEFDRLAVEQDGRCAICGTTEPKGRGNRLVIDHDHKTELHRGLLCSNCNVALGLFLDSPDILAAAIRYLERWQSARKTQTTPRIE